MISFKNFISEGGLWDNIHAKRARIKAGSGEKMRKPGSKGAPTKQDFIDAQEGTELQVEEHLVHVDDGSKYGDRPHPNDEKHVMAGVKKHNGTFDGVSDKGAYFKFKSKSDASAFKRHVDSCPHKTCYADLQESAAWQRKEGKSETGGLNQKGIASYRREHPGSKLSMAVTTKPSKLKPGSKAANRRKSFCARMSGVEGPMKKPNGEPTRKALALRKWNC